MFDLLTLESRVIYSWPCGCRVDRKSWHICDRNKEDKKNNFLPSKHVYYRYTHYHNRYKAHTDALDQESRIKRTILNKMEVLERKVISSDFSWVKDGLYKLFRSRRVLSNLYPFAYYMFGEESILLKDGITNLQRYEHIETELLDPLPTNIHRIVPYSTHGIEKAMSVCNTMSSYSTSKGWKSNTMVVLETKQTLFELHQDQLENFVEKLCNLLEEPFHLYDEDRIMEIRREVTNLSSVSDTLCKHLYEHIETELLDPLPTNIHRIVPYSTHGIEKAMSVCNTMSSYSTSKGWKSNTMIVIVGLRYLEHAYTVTLMNNGYNII
ncbi:RING/U-box superfamily protein isoform 4 [Artemisia annua]|uniref:RING/U-box superfamily protein isoform 4 n=1 Tax=Artemisia annua TaxID=35608 RepID=A0A2U1PNF3_ARTAN|nr:RING/U-box superfamily protein isoform 4 [Artemisia annua]